MSDKFIYMSVQVQLPFDINYKKVLAQLFLNNISSHVNLVALGNPQST